MIIPTPQEIDEALSRISDQEAADTLCITIGEMRAAIADALGQLDALIEHNTELTQALLESETECRELAEYVASLTPGRAQ